MESTRVSGLGVSFRGGRLRQLAILATAGTLGVTSQAEAAIYYWQDSPPAIEQSAPKAQASKAQAGHTKGTHRGDKKSRAVVERESKPQGPLIISISIAQQKLRLYDANGLFAESPVSTGMPGHTTPMGVFSVIQKQKFHQSNIYSGAPMPFMQRITWSGIAMHAGVLPGHPASHGCIRMPMAFAVKMYGWTRMGARVIVTPGDVTPASFSHPLLAAIKVVPQPTAAQETKADVAAVKALEKPVQAETAPSADEAKMELRSTVGHLDDVKSPGNDSHPASLMQVKTADASGALPTALANDPAQPPETKVSDRDEAAKATTNSNASKPDINSDIAKRDDVATSDEKPASEKSVDIQPTKTADGDVKPVEAANGPSKPEGAPAANEAAKTGDAAPVAATNASAAAPPKTAVAADKPADAAQAAAPATPATPPAAANETPLKDDLKTAAKADPGFSFKNAGQIAVFVSRKDSKLYIRQNFAPLFEVPVTIAADARPLGTHIFTAQVDSHDSNALHWSVVSLPTPAKAAERHSEERSLHSRKYASTAPIEAKPQPVPDSPAEALNRLSLPTEVMAKIYEAVSTGGSIIVSDQGIAAGETGEGTDFIVSLR